MSNSADKSVLRLELQWMTEKILNGEKRQLTKPEQNQVLDWQRRREQGEPLAYILGERGFYKNIFCVGPGALIPRPETEFVVEAALEIFKNDPPKKLMEFGFGSGCIGLSLLMEWPQAELIAVEKSENALVWAKKNIEKFNLQKRIKIFNQDVLSLDLKNKQFPLIISNPPYIRKEDEMVEENVRKFEPHLALYSGQSGLECIEQWTQKATEHLTENGYWIFEFGSGQTKEICAIIEQAGLQLVKVIKDYAGHDRVIVAKKATKSE